MAGVGRRTLYRKSVTDDYLNSTPEPGENEEIALAQAPRGSNIIEVSHSVVLTPRSLPNISMSPAPLLSRRKNLLLITPRRGCPAPPSPFPKLDQIMLASGEPALALLPTRFRKLIWVKRGDY
ncbi:unnamed protein product, partial [Hapterophycus canaliculatus]